jgi:hypothetical protein
VLSAEFHGFNNGSLTLPYSAARERGLTSKSSLQRGLKDLEARGLIVRTWSGGLGESLGCARYALGWKPIDANEKYQLRAAAAPNSWISWRDQLLLDKRTKLGERIRDRKVEKQNATLMARAARPQHETKKPGSCPHAETNTAGLLPSP